MANLLLIVSNHTSMDFVRVELRYENDRKARATSFWRII